MLFFTLSIVGSFFYGYFMNFNSPLPYFALAKSCGKVLDVCLGMLLIPVMRNFLTYLRSTAAAEKLPLDDNIIIHKMIAYTIAVSAICHIIFHFLDFAYLQNFKAVSYSESLLTLPAITGIIVVLLMLCLYMTAFLKRKIYMVG
jgi:hypothetical protein